MNCRPGDLAIVIRSGLGKSVGRLVTCIRLSEEEGLRNRDGSVDWGPIWETDDYGPTGFGQFHNLWADADLRPIRDPGDDATDESLLWAPAPEKVAA
jgi:hypothetical protein